MFLAQLQFDSFCYIDTIDTNLHCAHVPCTLQLHFDVLDPVIVQR